MQTDQKRVALLVYGEFCVYGGLQKRYLYVFGSLIGRYSALIIQGLSGSRKLLASGLLSSIP
ncbi:hypothetical protein EKN09_04465 [Vibrio penaeicida]|nr:hypothetical protein EKN09_04465 [Vibrio penaeicida]